MYWQVGEHQHCLPFLKRELGSIFGATYLKAREFSIIFANHMARQSCAFSPGDTFSCSEQRQTEARPLDTFRNSEITDSTLFSCENLLMSNSIIQICPLMMPSEITASLPLAAPPPSTPPPRFLLFWSFCLRPR